MNTPDAPPSQPISVLLAVPVRLYREGLVFALGNRPEVRVVAACDDSSATISEAVASRPDVVLIDVALPGAVDTIHGLRSTCDTKLIAFAVHDQEAQILTCIEAGASGYVTCDSSIDMLMAVIEGVARDELLCSPRVAATLVRRLAMKTTPGERPDDERRLTAREEQVFALIRDGLTNKEIAQRLNIAEATVKNHVHRVLAKLDASTRSQAVARASRLPILQARTMLRLTLAGGR
jgi:two-component system, NarL family, nitrate/nitrite response regulator NarL